MGDPVASNLLKTAAVMWAAPVGTALPDPDTIGAGVAWGAGWVRMGYTSSPLAVKYEGELFDIEVEEFLAAMDRVRVKEKLDVEVTLAELTADYLQRAIAAGTVVTVAAGPTHVGLETLEVGNDANLTKVAFGFEGIRYNDTGIALPVRFFVPRCTFKLNGDLAFSKKSTEYTGVPLAIQGLSDPANAGKLFKFQRTTAPKTV